MQHSPLILYIKYLYKNKQEALLITFLCSFAIWAALKLWKDSPILSVITMASGIALVIVKRVNKMLQNEMKLLNERIKRASTQDADK
jgi:hypothetical protein